MEVTVKIHDNMIKMLQTELSHSVTVEDLKNNPKVTDWFIKLFSDFSNGCVCDEYGLGSLITNEFQFMSETGRDLNEELGYDEYETS